MRTAATTVCLLSCSHSRPPLTRFLSGAFDDPLGRAERRRARERLTELKREPTPEVFSLSDRDAYADDVHYAPSAATAPAASPHRGERSLAPGGAMPAVDPPERLAGRRVRGDSNPSSWWCCNPSGGIWG